MDGLVALAAAAGHAYFLYLGYQHTAATGAVDSQWLVPVLAPLGYLLVLRALTVAMEGRAAYELRGAMAVYNAYSTGLSLVMFVLFARELASVPALEVWTTPSSGAASAVFWVATQSKVRGGGVARADGGARRRCAAGSQPLPPSPLQYLEFADTFFFALRKKKEQITSLHVIHHAEMGPLMWAYQFASPGNLNNAFGPCINALVHTIMYAVRGGRPAARAGACAAAR